MVQGVLCEPFKTLCKSMTVTCRQEPHTCWNSSGSGPMRLRRLIEPANKSTRSAKRKFQLLRLVLGLQAHLLKTLFTTCSMVRRVCMATVGLNRRARRILTTQSRLKAWRRPYHSIEKVRHSCPKILLCHSIRSKSTESELQSHSLKGNA